MHDGTGARDLGVDELERRRDRTIAEQALARPQYNREDPEAVLVDESEVVQRTSEQSAAVNLQLSPRPRSSVLRLTNGGHH